MTLLAFIISTSTGQRLTKAQIALVKAVQSRDIAKLRPYMDGSVRLQIVWDATGDQFTKALSERFSAEQLQSLNPPRQVSSGTLKPTTSPKLARNYLKSFAEGLVLTKHKNPDWNIFYQKDGGKEVIGRMLNDNVTETLEIHTAKNGRISLQRMIIEGHGSGFDDLWFNRQLDN